MPKKQPKAAAPKAPSKVEQVQLPPRHLSEDNQFQRGHDYRVTVNGHPRWLTKGSIETAIQRGQDVEVPKGSSYVVPGYLSQKSNCRGCGKR